MNTQNIEHYIREYLDHTSLLLLPVDNHKRPLTNHGYKNATRSAMVLHQFAKRYPNMGLGAHIGKESGAFAIDLDKTPSRGVSGQESLQLRYGSDFTFDFDTCLWTETPSGGMHMFFLWDESIPPETQIDILPNVDAKVSKGYVLLGPSKIIRRDGSVGTYTTHNINGAISPIQPWVRDLLNIGRSKSCANSPVSRTTAYREALNGIPEGKREKSIFNLAWGMRKDGVDIDTATAAIRYVAELCNPPFPENEAIAKVVRAYSHKLPTKKQGN